MQIKSHKNILVACILTGLSVGLGNVWRFPYLCYRNGGAVFLIPYFIMLLLIGMPMIFMEIVLGQFSSCSPMTVWSICPLFKGVGYAVVILSSLCCMYYNTVIAWTLYYLFSSFTQDLPWGTCDNTWNTPRCVIEHVDKNDWINSTASNVLINISHSNVFLNSTSPSEEFWSNHVLEISSGIEEIGKMRWPLLGCLTLAWIIVFLCLINGIKSSGKVVYITALFPYLVSCRRFQA